MRRDMDLPEPDSASDDEETSDTPRYPRIRLDSLDRVRREMAKLYVEAKQGGRDVQDASRLANILSMIGRLIEGGELEKRLQALEERAKAR
jgi:hypothetical protein